MSLSEQFSQFHMSLSEQFSQELAVIRTAKLTFLVGFIVLGVGIGYGEYSLFFKELLSQKDGIIKDKNELIDDLNKKLDVAKKIAPASAEPGKKADSAPIQRTRQASSRVSGPARTEGNDAPANTGDRNKFNYGNPPKNW